MNSSMNSVQTVTLNSALSQNWVVCTVRTPRNQVARTLRAQCPGRVHCSAHIRLVVHTASAGHAHSQRRLRAWHPGRGRKSRPPSLAQPQARSQHQNQVATLLETTLCRDINLMSRPRFCPHCDFQVATPKSRSRPPPLPPMSRPQN